MSTALKKKKTLLSFRYIVKNTKNLRKIVNIQKSYYPNGNKNYLFIKIKKSGIVNLEVLRVLSTF